MLLMIAVFILIFGAVGVHIFRDSYHGLGCGLDDNNATRFVTNKIP